jgi:hypothetical protein
MDEIASGTEPKPPSRRARRIGAAAAAGIGITLGAAGIAAAASDPSPAPSGGATARIMPPGVAPAMPGGRPGPGRGPRGERGIGPGGALHGEFVVPDRKGGYRTMRMQRGVVTSVSATALTVKSTDGYATTYVIDEKTLVNAGRDGIASVKKDEEVSVLATVAGGSATAVNVRDVTKLKAQRRDLRPRRR